MDVVLYESSIIVVLCEDVGYILFIEQGFILSGKLWEYEVFVWKFIGLFSILLKFGKRVQELACCWQGRFQGLVQVGQYCQAGGQQQGKEKFYLLYVVSQGNLKKKDMKIFWVVIGFFFICLACSFDFIEC